VAVHLCIHASIANGSAVDWRGSLGLDITLRIFRHSCLSYV
jgi:hypothetical protein